MYQEHVPQIREYALRSPTGLGDVLTFSMASAHVRFEQMGGIMASIRREGEDSPWLLGAKRRGYRFIRDNAADLWRYVALTPTAEGVMAAFVKVPGLGLVKAGFAAQMLGHNVACLDTHNQIELGLTYPRLRKEQPVYTIQNRIAEYIALCRLEGTPEWFWDNWCEWRADPDGPLPTAEDVSRYHVECIKGGSHV